MSNSYSNIWLGILLTSALCCKSVKDFLHFAVVSVCKCIDQTGIRLILFVRNQQAIQTVSGHFLLGCERKTLFILQTVMKLAPVNNTMTLQPYKTVVQIELDDLCGVCHVFLRWKHPPSVTSLLSF